MFPFFLKSQRSHIFYITADISHTPANHVFAMPALSVILLAMVLLLFSAVANAADDDCIENGGTYVCTSPVWAETAETGDNGYIRGSCDLGGSFQVRTNAWCVAASPPIKQVTPTTLPPPKQP
jgi:hypothetical protein